LCGVLTHIGSQIKSGHYITEIRKGDNWWKCNDDKVSQTTFDSLSKQAYGLLFQKM
jgi:ubiquitin C-terminal hydrolase